MAIEIRFNCDLDPDDFLIVDSDSEYIKIEGIHQGDNICFYCDVSTAIKLSKTIRTHINKVKGI